MIEHPLFPCHEWEIRESALDLSVLAQTESMFALSNGHIGWRGNLEEGEPHEVPGTYLNGVYEVEALPYAEAGYGYPEAGESVVNVTNGKIIRLMVDDELLDVRYGLLEKHQRKLDMKNGVLEREVMWITPTGKRVHITSTRIVSFTQRAIAGIEYEVKAVDSPMRIVVQSELVANESLPHASGDPRSHSPNDHWLQPLDHENDGLRATLVHSTVGSGQLIAAGMHHEVFGPDNILTETEGAEDFSRVTTVAQLEPGQSVRIIKYVAYGWSSTRSLPALRDQVHAALVSARHSGWKGLLKEQARYLDDFWRRSDVKCDGDADLQQAVRFSLFHVLQSSARAEGRAIPAKGLTGPGYQGHAFWDSEVFVMPILVHTRPEAAADALRWRHSTLPAARERAAQLGLAGASFPWRTITGAECSSYWPAGTAGFHINADVADALIRYVDATGDTEFERTVGLEVLVETARLWMSLGHFRTPTEFRIDGVTGPDEYTAVVDNNIYTNLMAEQNLRVAAHVAARHPVEAAALSVSAQERELWAQAAAAMAIPYDEELGVHPQSEGFTHHEMWDFDNTEVKQYPLLLNFPYFDLYRKQVVKQADLVLAMHMRPERFSREQKVRNFSYYEAITVRDSSLSAATQAVIAAEVGHRELALDYLMETAAIDLTDLQENTRDGIHLAALAGTWTGLVMGFGGMRQMDDHLSFRPTLPPTMTRMTFSLMFRDSCLRVCVEPTVATYTLDGGSPLTLIHEKEEVKLTEVGASVCCDITPRIEPDERPQQPAGRAPLHHETIRKLMRSTGEKAYGYRLAQREVLDAQRSSEQRRR